MMLIFNNTDFIFRDLKLYEINWYEDAGSEIGKFIVAVLVSLLKCRIVS